MSEDITVYKLDTAFVPIKNYDLLAKDDHYMEVSIWHNGEGFDVKLDSNGLQCFQLTWGEFKTLKKLIKKLEGAT